MNSFSELPLSPTLKANLARHNFSTPTPVQAEAIPAALRGRDIIATAQTGTGKTLAFLLPMVERLTAQRVTKGVRAVILSPTRELALQILESFNKIAQGTQLKAVAVVGGMNENRQLHSLQTGSQVVIATPGRLCDFLNRRLINLTATSFFVLDEADRMLDMGFLPSIKTIMQSVPGERQTMFFSATMERSVAHLVESQVTNPVRIAIGAVTKPTDQVDLSLFEIEQGQKTALLQHLIRTETGSFLVFVRTKHGADRLADKLQRLGVRAARIHGNRTQNQRNQALDLFKKGDYRVLVATDVAARGIHVDGIGHVVNYDLPQAPEDFIHRIGRTGRAGARGSAVTFSTRAERRDVRDIEKSLGKKLAISAAPADLAAQAALEQSMPSVPSAESERSREMEESRRRSAAGRQQQHAAGRHSQSPRSSKVVELPRPERRSTGGPAKHQSFENGGNAGRPASTGPKVFSGKSGKTKGQAFGVSAKRAGSKFTRTRAAR
jgi:ATP-dependent RNA helicase RhlE